MTDLIDLAEYKAFEKKSDSADDDRLAMIIPAVSNYIKGFCGRTFIDYYSSTKVVTLDVENEGESIIFLDEIPLNTVTLVQERSSLADDWITLVADGTDSKYEYVVDNAIGKITRTSASSYKHWPCGPARVRVEYTGGYDGAANLPPDLRIAAFEMVSYQQKRSFQPSRTVQGNTFSNDPNGPEGAGYPNHITRVLNAYRI